MSVSGVAWIEATMSQTRHFYLFILAKAGVDVLSFGLNEGSQTNGKVERLGVLWWFRRFWKRLQPLRDATLSEHVDQYRDNLA
jgi:hypothetical protein